VDYLNYIIKFERHPTDGIALGAFSAKVKIRVYENRNLGLRRCPIIGNGHIRHIAEDNCSAARVA
jgi:hypothetical protein